MLAIVVKSGGQTDHSMDGPDIKIAGYDTVLDRKSGLAGSPIFSWIS